MEAVHSETYKNYRIDIFPDMNPENPRKEWDNAAHIICCHSRYNLGDDDMTREEFIEMFEEYSKRKDVVFRKLYLYDHSNISISMESFIGRAQHAEWDSGIVGFIYMTYDDIRKNWGIKKVTKKYIEQALELMQGEVKTYDNYISGNVYGFKVIKIEKDENGEEVDGEEIDSCWGFFGDYNSEDIMNEAKAAADWDEKKRLALFEGEISKITS